MKLAPSRTAYICMAIMFCAGILTYAITSWKILKIGRITFGLTKPIDLARPLDACHGHLPALALIEDKYRVYIMFPTSLLTQDDKDYFDFRSGQRTKFFWEALGASLRITLVDDKGRLAPLAVEGDTYSQFIFGPHGTGQSIGVFDNSRLQADNVTVQYSIDGNCGSLLSHRPQIRIIARSAKDIQLIRMLLFFLTIPLLLITLKWTRKAVRTTKATKAA